MATPNIALPTVPNGQTNISAAYNAAMQTLDALLPLVIQDKDLNAPPVTVGGDVGKRWIVGPAPTGAWTGHANEIALCTAATVWAFIVAPARIEAWIIDEATTYLFGGATWTPLSGSYTPALTGITNYTSGTAEVSAYTRVGNVVTLSGRINVTPTAAATLTEVNINAPIASNFAASTDASGPATYHQVSGALAGAASVNSIAANTLRLSFISANTSSHEVRFSISYPILP